MGKGLIAQWRRGIVSRGIVGAVLFAVPVAVAAAIGFGTSLSGVVGGLSALANGPDTSSPTVTTTPIKLNRAVVALASRDDSGGSGGGAQNNSSVGSDVGGTDTGGGTAGGGGSGGSGGGSSTPTIDSPDVPQVDLPGGGGSTEDAVNDVGNTVNGVLDGVGNTVNGVLGQ